MDVVLLLVTLNHFQSALSIKIVNLNTFGTFANPHASELLPQQIQQVAQSDIQVLCLQELHLIPTTARYLHQLESFGFTHSFSMLNVEEPVNLQPPRTPCGQLDQTQKDALKLCTQCTDLSKLSSVTECLATECPVILNEILYSECTACLGFYPDIQPDIEALDASFKLTLDGALLFCSNPPDLTDIGGCDFNFRDNLFNFTDGVAIVTREEYPIINKWSFPIPSHLLFERRVYIAEINICHETDPDGGDCTDSMIVGCTHLEATNNFVDAGIVQSPRLEDDSITSLVGLNRLQTQYILDNVFNDVLMGDLNSGQLFNRCDNCEGPDISCEDADNCEDEDPSNPFDLWKLGEFVDAPDIKYTAGVVPEVLCTYCYNENSLAKRAIDSDPAFISGLDFDSDHILVQDGYCKNFKAISFEREFVDETATIPGESGMVPISDHYGVRLELEFNENKGGRRGEGRCTKESRTSRSRTAQKTDDAETNNEIIDDNNHKTKSFLNGGGNNMIIIVVCIVISIILLIIIGVVVYIKKRNYINIIHKTEKEINDIDDINNTNTNTNENQIIFEE